MITPTFSDADLSGDISAQLTACQTSGLIDRFMISDKSVLIFQGRYAHKIPVGRACTFIAGLLQYADAAGFDSAGKRAA